MPDAAMLLIYSLLINARRRRLDPAAWFTDVVRWILTCQKIMLIELLL
jgi:hypothetical protein